MNQFFKAAFNVFFTKKHFKMYFFKGLFQNFDKNDSTKMCFFLFYFIVITSIKVKASF
jgi:hypothetical protein